MRVLLSFRYAKSVIMLSDRLFETFVFHSFDLGSVLFVFISLSGQKLQYRTEAVQGRAKLRGRKIIEKYVPSYIDPAQLKKL